MKKLLKEYFVWYKTYYWKIFWTTIVFSVGTLPLTYAVIAHNKKEVVEQFSVTNTAIANKFDKCVKFTYELMKENAFFYDKIKECSQAFDDCNHTMDKLMYDCQKGE